MNRIFRIVWSQALSTWVVVSELATRRGKRSSGAEVDERSAPLALMLDRDIVEGSPPTAWPLRVGIVLALLCTVASPASAADLYWDINGNTAGSGGTGTWDTTNLFWNTSATGTGGTVSGWNNATFDTAVFGGTAGTVTLGAPITVGGLRFTTNYTLNGGTLTLGGAAPTIDVTIGGGNVTINSALAGSAGFTKTGTGTLVLGANNSGLTGPINFNGGTLQAAAVGAFGVNAAVTQASGAGVFWLNGFNQSIGSLAGGTAGAGTGVNLGSATLTVGSNDTSTTYIGRIVGTGSLVKVGSGTLTLSNSAGNLYSGGTTINSGRIDVGATAALGTGTVTMAAGSTLGFSAAGVSLANAVQLTGPGAATLDTGAFSGTLSGAISGAGALNKNGSGTLTLSGNNSGLTGTITVNAGTLRAGATNNNLGGTAAIVLANTAGVTLDLANSTQRIGSLAGGGALGGNVVLGGASGFLEVGYDNTSTTYGGVISGAGGINKMGTGTLTLAGQNTYGFTTFVSGGTLRAGVDNAISAAGGLNLSGGNFDTNGFNQTALWLSGAGSLQLGGSASFTTNQSFNATLSGVVSGTGNLVKQGTGTLTLSNTNTYTGTTTINSGMLTAGAAAGGRAFGFNSAVTIANAAVAILNLNNFGQTIGSLSGGGATGGEVRLGSGTLTTGGNNTSTSYAGVITGFNGNLIKEGSGTQTLSGTNTYTGTTTINAGTLQAGAAAGGQAFGTSAVTLANVAGATLDLNNFNQTIGSLAGGGATGGNVLLGTATLTTGTKNTSTSYAGVISGSGGLTKTGTGVQTLSGTNTYTGATTINGGTLRAGAAAGGQAFGINSAVTLANVAGATLDLGGTVQRIGSLTGGGTLGGNVSLLGSSGVLDVGYDNTSTTFAGVISGAATTGSVWKRGTGTLTLTGVNTYGSQNRVYDGTLRAGAVQAFGVNTRVELFSNSAVLDLNGFNHTFSALVGISTPGASVLLGSATLTTGANNSNSGFFSGVISGTGGLTKIGTGRQDLLGVNTYTGATTVNAGTLRALGNLTGGQAFGNLSAVTIANVAGATLDLNNTAQTIGSLSGGGATGGTVALGTTGTGRLTTGGNNTSTTFAGVITGTGGLTKVGTGTQTLSGASTYTGTTLINAGTLQAGAAAGGQAFGNLSAVTLADVAGATLDLNGFDQTIGSLAGGGAIGGNVLLGAGTLTTGGNNTNTTFAGTITGTGGLAKAGTGTLTLTGTANSVGATTVSGGTLDIDGTLDTGTVTMGAGTLNIDGTVQASGATQAVFGNIAGTDSIVNVNSGATLRASGDLGDGNDLLDVRGTLDTGGGTFALGDGDDTLTIHDGTNIMGTVAAGAGTDTFNTDIATIANLGAVQGFETLTKTGVGTLNINGVASSDFNTVNVLAGRLDVTAGGVVNAAPGSTLTTTVATGATLNVDGSYGCGDLADTMTVAGTVSGNGTVDLCAGDDTLTIQDGANLSGLLTAINGGDGTDTLIADIANSAILGGATDFETLIKSNIGTLSINGPANSQFDTVLVQGGTLIVGAGAIVDPQTTVVSSGATMTVNGTYNGTTGDDTFDVSGTVNGVGFIDLLDGDDILTLNDGADINGLTNPLDGGAHVDGDTVVLNNALDFTFDGGKVVNFEHLEKTGGAETTLIGTSQFSGSTTISEGMLTVADTLETPTVDMADGTTLNVNGLLQGAGATPAVITGSAGSNTISVGALATLLASGDLGTGNDSLDVAGTLDTGGGTFALGDGDDTLTIHDGTSIIGTVNAGIGIDTFNTHITTSASIGAVQEFEALSKTGAGVLNIDGPAVSDFLTVDVLEGALNIAVGGGVAAQTTTIASGTTLTVDGTYTGTGGGDFLTVAGTVTGNGTLDLLDGDDSFTIQDGADLSGLASSVDGGAGTDTFVADLAGTATLGGAVNFETLTKTNGGTLIVAGAAPSAFTTVNVDGGELDVGAGGSIDGVVTTTVASGATLNVDGIYNGSTGDDTFDVAGTVSGASTIDLSTGDDTLTLHDNVALNAVIDGGDHSAGDTVVLDNNSVLTFDGGNTLNFEYLIKNGLGATTLTGTQVFSGGTDINDGTVTVAGSLETPIVELADNTTLTIDGSLQGNGGTEASITGSAGLNTVTINGTALATGDLDDGNDTLDVVGTLDTGGGTFNLGDGDDNFVVHDGSVVIGIIDGGLGVDSRTYDIDGTADLGSLVNFEGLTKSGSGTLNLNSGVTDLLEVDVLEGVLNVAAGASVVARTKSPLDTLVATGATLSVEGSFGCGSKNDTMTVAGTVSGGGTIDMCDGDDTLTLQDGVALNAVISGGLHGAGDTVVLDSANALTFDASNTTSFEFLQKDNIGTATLAGSQAFSGGTTINGGTLDVDGMLESPTVAMGDDTTLNVDGLMFGTGGTAVAITGSAGVNTVTVNGTLLADGDLGAGNDLLDVAGTLVTAGGVFGLGDGDDTLTIHDGTNIIGTVAAGAGTDTLNADIATSADLGAVQEFESLIKSGIGSLNINGPGTSDFTSVDVLAGTLNVNLGSSVAAQTTTVATGATLNVDGTYTGTNGSDAMTVAGTVTGIGTIDLLDGDDTFTIQDGADLSGLANSVDGGAGTDTFVADLTGTATLGGAVNFETLTKTNTGTLIVAGAAPSAFTTVNVDGGTLDVGVGGSIDGVTTTTVANGATLNVDGIYTGSAGNDRMTVAGTVSGASTIDLADGDDTLTLQDGVSLQTVIDGGANGTGDTVVLDSVNALTFDAGNTVNFEFLQKDNVGTATLTGTQTFSGGTVINGGTLDVDGTLETPTVALADDTTLNVDGLLQGLGGTVATIDGSDGANTVAINGTALATGDLGAGDDVLDVAGTLDTVGGTFVLGDGDDSFVVHDGTNVVGTVDGGAGLDTRVYDIDLTADLGAMVSFEGVTKTGIGTLNINGPGTTDLQEVSVLEGTLNVGGSVVATTGSTLDTVVAAGATLNVDGSYGCGAGDDSMNVSGTVSGSGTIDMCDGNDTLTLTDSAVLATAIDGGGNGSIDTVVLDSAVGMTFDAVNTINFEALRKEGAGVATLVGTQSYDSTAINGGTLDVDGTLETPTIAMGDDTTLNVDGLVQGAGGTAAAITGSDGANTVLVRGTLLANGDLGDGSDLLDVAGTLDTAGGAFVLGDGDDTLTIHDGTNIIGTVVAGDGNDTFNTDINTTADLGAVQGFETLSKTGTGELNINGLLSSDFTTVNVLEGTLDVTAGGSVIAQNTTVAAGSTLNIDGSYTGTAGSDTLTVAGTVTGSSGIDLLDGDDSFTIQDGANLSGLANPVDGGAGTDTFVADIATNATLGGAVNFETLTKTNTGTLIVAGAAPSAFTTVNVLGGTLDVGVNGSIDGVVTTTVASGTTLNVDGSFTGSDGSDTMTVAGTVSGTGTVALLDGDDTLTLQDGADTSGLSNALDGGAGTDTVSADVATAMTLGATVNFETLQKSGVGVLTLDGDQAYGTTQLDAGTTTIATGTTLTSQDTTVASGATLDVQGTFTGTAGDNSFTSAGTVIGALGFADGNDTVAFNGGDISGLTAVDGGAGGTDRLTFGNQTFDGSDFALTGWERVELSNDSTMTLSNAFTFGGGVLAIDATSQLDANAGASIDGSVENAGLINLGANRMAISGGYQGLDGALELHVSPANATSGGLDIDGDVTGNTFVTFTSDGTDVPVQQDTSILVIASPNDNLATAGSFTAADAINGRVRLTGSILPWTLGQHEDNNWYLDAVAGILPETAGYAVLSSIGQSSIADNNRLLFQRMGAVRSDTSTCHADDKRAATVLKGDCHGTWMAVFGSELEMGANPGFEFSGDSVGAYVGVDALLQDRETRTFRGGLFAGFQRGNYWTTGVNSTDLPGTGESNVRVDTPTFGMYGSFNWKGGSYADVSLVGQLPKADIAVADGFRQEISGNSLTLSTQVGHRFALGNGWTVEPQVELSVSAMQWGGGQIDASGKALILDDDVLGTARAAVRAEKVFETSGGARVRSWATLGLEDTVGEKRDGFRVELDSDVQAFPNHQPGLTATLDVGMEAQVNQSVSVYGSLSYGESVQGTDAEQRQANVGVRIRW